MQKGISPDDNEFVHLHPAQIVKHFLGLKRQFGRAGFRLLYLWYDVFGGQGKRHRDQVLKFTEITKNDGIKFHSITYQELIVHLANKLRIEHPGYIRYLTDRYLQCKWIALPGNFEPCLALDGYSAGSP